jgi:hypothetical protein
MRIEIRPGFVCAMKGGQRMTVRSITANVRRRACPARGLQRLSASHVYLALIGRLRANVSAVLTGAGMTVAPIAAPVIVSAPPGV